MSDVMHPEQRRRAMSHIKGNGTSIEVILWKALWHKSIRKIIKSCRVRPITKYRIAIFCDREFFHGYNWEIKKQKLGHNQEYWIKKIERNMVRDRENDFKLMLCIGFPCIFGGKRYKNTQGNVYRSSKI